MLSVAVLLREEGVITYLVFANFPRLLMAYIRMKNLLISSDQARRSRAWSTCNHVGWQSLINVTCLPAEGSLPAGKRSAKRRVYGQEVTPGGARAGKRSVGRGMHR